MKQYFYRLLEIYRAIDNAYNTALNSYNFSCSCYRFITEKEAALKDSRINPTNFYFEIVRIAKAVREKLNFKGRYKKTTAGMVLSIINGK